MKYKKGDCFLANERMSHWGTAVIVDDSIAKTGHKYYMITWTGLVGRGPFEWAELSLDELKPATKLHRLILGLDNEV